MIGCTRQDSKLGPVIFNLSINDFVLVFSPLYSEEKAWFVFADITPSNLVHTIPF